MKIASVMAIFALTASPAIAQSRCINGPEAEAMTLVALPDIIRETSRVCGDSLPPGSLVRRPTPQFLGKYEAEADRAWPIARGAIVKLSDPAVTMLLDSDFARPMLTALLTPLIVGRIATGDCPTIDRLVTLLEPLPPRNTAGVVVTALQYLKAAKAKGAKVAVPNLPLCPAEAR